MVGAFAVLVILAAIMGGSWVGISGVVSRVANYIGYSPCQGTHILVELPVNLQLNHA